MVSHNHDLQTCHPVACDKLWPQVISRSVFTSILETYTTVTELCRRVHEAAPERFASHWSSCAENLAETGEQPDKQKKLVMPTGNISILHFIAVDISLTWFAQIANISEFPHQMEILCLIATQRRMPAHLSHHSQVQPCWPWWCASLLWPPVFQNNTRFLVCKKHFHKHCALLFSLALQLGNDPLLRLAGPTGRQSTCFMNQEIARQGNSRQL